MVKGRGSAWYIPRGNAVCSDEEIIIRGKKVRRFGLGRLELADFFYD